MDIERILQEMTPEEKASLCPEAGCGQTAAVARLGLPSVTVAGGVRGLYRLTGNPAEPAPSVCFPSPVGMGASFDRDLARELGSLIGQSALHEHVDVLLGPSSGTRQPLQGTQRDIRYAEDPFLAEALAEAFAGGVRAQGVGAVLRPDADLSPDDAARRMLTQVDFALANRREPEEFDWGMQHHQARKLAREAMVLLKNDGDLLPITGNKKVAFIGAYAERPLFQPEAGSIRCTETLSALQAVRSVSPVTYVRGFDPDRDEPDPALEAEAVRAAAEADIAVLFLGAPFGNLPACQNALAEAVAAVQPRVAVVLHNGAPVGMPWIDRVSAVLETYLGGQAVGGATVDVLFGAVSPCGKLPEAFPLFPFGHGLTYTRFAYANLRLSADRLNGTPVTACVDVTNTGKVYAKEAVLIYLRRPSLTSKQPFRALKGFAKLALAPGQTGTVSVTLDRDAFVCGKEHARSGSWIVEAAASAVDIRCCAEIIAPDSL